MCGYPPDSIPTGRFISVTPTWAMLMAIKANWCYSNALKMQLPEALLSMYSLTALYEF